MVRNRSRRAVIAGVASVIWLAYMMIGLPVINTALPTVAGHGPEGTRPSSASSRACSLLES